MESCVAYPGSNSPVSVPLQVTVNGVMSTATSVQGIPDPTLSYVSPRGQAAVGTPLLIRGQNLGSTQGQSTITFNGATMTPTSWSATAIVAPVPAAAGGGGFVDVIVGGALVSYPGPSVGTLPTPTSLQITPAGVNMLVGSTKQFIVMDNQGLLRYDATWTVDNSNLGSVTTDSTPTLTALAAGTLTLTATVQGVSAQMPVTISALSSFPNGTILWSAPPTPGFSPAQIVQAIPSDFGPSAYSVQVNSTQTLVQAFTGEGQEMWQATLPTIVGNAVPDGSGGLIVTEACNPANPSANPMTSIDFDAVTGTTLWQAPITSSQNACPAGPPRFAVRQDGLIVIAAPLQTSPALIFAGGQFGTAPAIPPSTITDQFGTVSTCDCYTPLSAPIVDSDGSIYVEYEVRQITESPASISSILSLMKIGADGSATTTQLSSSDSANLFPGTLMPDGTGGVVATWTIVNMNPPAAPLPYQAAYTVGGTVMSAYALPMAPTQVVNGANGLPVNPSLILGESGIAFASYNSNLTSFYLSAGSAIWNYAYTQGVSSVSYADGGGLTLADAVGNQVPIDSGGNAGPAIALSATLLQPSWSGVWQGAFGGSNIGLASISAPFMDWGHSFWAAQGGSPSPSGVSKEMSWFPVLPNCPGTQQPCIYNALGDLITRLQDPAISSLAQTNIFNRLGRDANGNQYTTAGFVTYLRNMQPRFYDGLRSTYCSEILTHDLTESLCFQNPLLRYTLNLLSTDVKDKFTSTIDALTSTPSNPLLTFFRPTSLGSSSSGQNLGNEALIFHEALHGFTGQQDDPILTSLGMNWVTHGSCSITVRIQKKVLSQSAGLDPSVQWNVVIPCPTVGDE